MVNTLAPATIFARNPAPASIASIFDPLNATPYVAERVYERRRSYRAVWISDIHLGTRGCNAKLLIDFFDHIDCDTMYLVGDIIDGWALKKRHYWPPEHNDVVWRVLKRARRGTRVIYIPGNHDEMIRPFAGVNFGGVEIAREAIHTTADGRRLLVLHGDEFDAIMLTRRWLAVLGDTAYTWMLRVNVVFNRVRSALGLPYYSLSMAAKHKVKNAVQFISKYEEVVAQAARQRGADGVVCGHIHSAEMRDFDAVAYYNDGDWVEGCTALVEHHDGTMEILRWADEVAARSKRDAEAVIAAAGVAA
jgi:UDP-2,3-diacylglucosamine pyrophosphatase LpxH